MYSIASTAVLTNQVNCFCSTLSLDEQEADAQLRIEDILQMVRKLHYPATPLIYSQTSLGKTWDVFISAHRSKTEHILPRKQAFLTGQVHVSP
jgi:hypothetical protein